MTLFRHTLATIYWKSTIFSHTMDKKSFSGSVIWQTIIISHFMAITLSKKFEKQQKSIVRVVFYTIMMINTVTCKYYTFSFKSKLFLLLSWYYFAVSRGFSLG